MNRSFSSSVRPGARKKLLFSFFLLAALLLAAVDRWQALPVAAFSASPRAGQALPASANPGLQTQPFAETTPQIRFENLSLEQGLSQSVVADIVQDQQGFLWFATQEGLNRFDGYEFRTFKHEPQDANSLSGNTLAGLELDPSGDLWIGATVGGLSRYNPPTDQFTHYLNDPEDPNSLSSNAVTTIFVDAQGIVWIGTGNSGLNRLDPVTGQLTHYRTDPNDPQSLSSDSITSVLVDRRGDLWVGTGAAGLNRLDRATGKFLRFQTAENDPQSLSSNNISVLYEDRSGDVWVGTINAGLNRFIPAANGFAHYRLDPDDPTTLSLDWISTLFEDSRGNFWVGTNGGGLNLLDRQSGGVTRYRNNPDNPASLSNDFITSSYEDRSGILWFGTFGAGVDRYDPYRYKFGLFQHDPNYPRSLTNQIWSITQDTQGAFWIGTSGGLLHSEAQSGAWRLYATDPEQPNSLSDQPVYIVYQDRQGMLWLGTQGGLDRFDPRTEQFTHYNTPPFVLTIYEDWQGNFWVGSFGGLLDFDRTSGNFTLYTNNPDDLTSISSNAISAIFEDSQGNMWIGTTNGGINRFDRQSGTFQRFVNDPLDPSSLSTNAVLSMMQSSQGVLWIATSGGLNRYHPETETFTVYRESDGLPNDFIYGILEDSQGFLWLSTNRGLSRFNPEQIGFKNYDKSDGLQSNEFNQGAYYKDAEGRLYFGGIYGLNYFNPLQIQDNTYIPPVVITHFRIFNQEVEPGPDAPLASPIEFTQAIKLHYTASFFDFEFASLHFSSPEEIQYAYQLEDLDQDWITTKNRRFASYTNVPPGNYTFRVKATNSDGVWNEQGAAVKISIPPPFWQTWWFRLLAIVGLVGAAAVLVGLRIRGIEKQRQQLEIQVSQRTSELHQTMIELEHSKEAAESANRAKSAFLANMSHEFRTPLNAILGFTQLMVRDEQLNPEQQENLEIIHRSSEHLLGLINDVLEMSKIEAGRTTLNQRNFDLHRMLLGLEEMFAMRAEGKGIALHLELDPGVPRYVYGDEGKLRQVLMNLLGNAVKFTEHGQVMLLVQSSLAEHDQAALVSFAVEDTGPGIASEELERLFTPFVQTASGRQAQEGTGLGLPISQQYVHLMGGDIQISSTVGEGSVFKFQALLGVVKESELEQPRSSRRVVGLEPGQPVYRMLVVDDMETNRRLLIKIFAPLGFEVREAANGKEAVETAETWQPHLIFMDMRMPVMDGYEATRRIKGSTRGQAIVIVALTASGLEEDRAVILSEGCDDYLRKPFIEEDVFAAVARHLGVRYAYADDKLEASAAPLASAAEPLLSPELSQDLTRRLAASDPAWLAALEQATILGDLVGITQLANQAASWDPSLAQNLTRLANRYEHDRILFLIQRAKDADFHAASG